MTARTVDGLVAGVFRKLVPGNESVTAISQGPVGIMLAAGGTQKARVLQKVSEPSRPWGKVSVGRA